MPRHVLDESRIHPSIREKIASRHRDLVEEVEAAIAKHDVVVVGMGINPHPKRASKALRDANIAFEYLEYGSYVSAWRPRTALKMWTGWPTFPMVFVKGTLVGGADDVIRPIASGELAKMLG
jgi:glutaredoxin-related protein